MISRNSEGIKIAETLYEGPENYEKATLATSFDLEGNILTKTSYIYNAAGALEKAITTDASGVKLAETDYTGLTNQGKPH